MNMNYAIRARLLAIAGFSAIACLGAPGVAHAGSEAAADAATAEASAPSATFVPQAIGDWTRVEYSDNTEHGDRPLVIEATYVHPDINYDYDFKIGWSLATRADREMAKATEHFGEDLIKKIKRGGRTIHVATIENNGKFLPALILKSGDVAAWLEPECRRVDNDVCGFPDADAAMEALLGLYNGFDFDQLIASYTLPRPGTDAVDAGPGFAPYAAFVGDTTMAFAHPQDWQVLDFFARSGRRDALVVVRDLEAVQSPGRHLDRRGLPSAVLRDMADADNALVTLEVYHGRSNGFDAESVGNIRRALPNLFDTLELAGKPTKTTVGGVPAFDSMIRGDIDGQAVVMRLITFRPVGGEAYRVNVMRPEDSQVRKAVHVLIDSISVTPRPAVE